MTERTSTTDARHEAATRKDGSPADVQAWTASGLNILAGTWLIVAPWVLNYSDAQNAVWNQVTIGVVVALLAMFRVAMPERFASLSWINAVLGSWLVIAPFILQYESGVDTTAIYWNDIITGLVIISLAVWSALATKASRSRR